MKMVFCKTDSFSFQRHVVYEQVWQSSNGEKDDFPKVTALR